MSFPDDLDDLDDYVANLRKEIADLQAALAAGPEWPAAKRFADEAAKAVDAYLAERPDGPS
jgi:hypothetical protein